MKKGTPVTARYGSKNVHGQIISSVEADGETVYCVKWSTGECWFNAPLLRPYTPHQLTLF